jgi:hypothetical protein
MGETWVGLVHEVTPFNGAIWTDHQIPKTLPGAEANDLYLGPWLKTEIDASAFETIENLAGIQGLLADQEQAKLLATDGTSPIEGFPTRISGVLIMDRTGGLHLFVVLSGKSAIPCSQVRSKNVSVDSRSPQRKDLDIKAIGIVGIGSVGSKMAVTLARMGVQKFYLVDHDLLLPENLHRHALDWQGVGQHKVDAVMAAIRLIAPAADVQVCRLHISGQESNAAVGGALNRLGACDLLIDATANPRVFNTLAAVARTACCPMVWMAVFGGGLGGLVARSRPRIDPTPQDMRAVYLKYCSDNPSPSFQSAGRDYSTEDEDGQVQSASDSDVSIIAHHAARFVADCFTPSERSAFPNSMYLVGLTAGWVFEAPFATIPISMESCPVKDWSNGEEVALGEDNIEFVRRLVEKEDDTAPDTSGDPVAAD